MATKKRKRKRRLSSTALLSSPGKKRRKNGYQLSTSPKKKKRKRGLSELGISKAIGLSPAISRYTDPVLEGAIGGAAAKAGVKLIPTTFLNKPEIKPYENWWKGGALLGLSLLAAGMKQPLVAAGMAGAATYKFMEAEGIMNDDGDRNFRATRFVAPNLLANRAQINMLTPNSPYANYQPLYGSGRMLSDTPLLSDAYDDMGLRI